jgi:hypothetical protein
MDQKEEQRQIDAIWKKLDDTSSTANEALTLARHADKGYVELHGVVKNMKDDIEKQNSDINALGGKFEKFIEKVQEKLTNNLKWIIGFIFMLLTAYTTFIIIILTNRQ